MFDDENKEPKDMFEETDKAAPQVTPPTAAPAPEVAASPAPASAPAPTTPAPAAAPQGSINDRMAELQIAKKGVPWKPIVLVLAIVAVIVAAFLLSMKILNSRTPTTPDSPSVAEETTQAGIKTEFKSEETVEETTPAEDLTLDTDKDGLTDAREAELGTDPTNEDTDADGLFDREEVEVYKTNPLNPDTDGDTFTDGGEVEGGYNPNGEGMLLNLPN